MTDDTFDIVTYKEHDQISLVDGDDKPFLHGRVVDPEPVVPDLKGYSEGTVVQSHWILVMCPKVVQGWANGIVIDDDMVFNVNGESLNKRERQPARLAAMSEFLIYRQWVKPRVRGVRKKKS